MNTLNVHSEFFVLLKRLPQLNKEDLVWEYSRKLTNSLSEFYSRRPKDYARMVRDMKKTANNMATDPKKETKKLRSAILHRLQKHGVDTTDWDCVNRFLENPRIAGKRLYAMSNDEMRTLIKKMERILIKDKVLKAEINRLEQLN